MQRVTKGHGTIGKPILQASENEGRRLPPLTDEALADLDRLAAARIDNQPRSRVRLIRAISAWLEG